MEMHHFDEETEKLAERIAQYSVNRLKEDPPTLDGTTSPEMLLPLLENVITKDGLGPQAAFDVFENIVGPSTISTDHPRYLAFVPNAPTNAASLFDLVVSASSMYGGTWLEGSGIVAAENQALRFLSEMIGFPETAGGVFVSGGTAANLSALLAARWRFREQNPGMERERLAIACAPSAHSSVRQAARAMDIDILDIPGDEFHRLTSENLKKALDSYSTADNARLFAIVASAGATNSGYVDELSGTGALCNKRNLWFHVDGAYGGAGLLCKETAPLFDGVHQADSFVVDPHKWLFSPYDCAALIYKDPDVARRAHSQHAEYLDAVTDTIEWNPSDYAHHLTRRARGLPFWFTLAVHGTDAVGEAVTKCVETTQAAADLIRNNEHVELVLEPQLSVILLRRKGWTPDQYDTWCASMLEKEYAFVVPTTYNDETVLRFCIINPVTNIDDFKLIIDLLT
jgi:glutamate/tyrosine decarboxylase-like PLP-dependent enzyme